MLKILLLKGLFRKLLLMLLLAGGSFAAVLILDISSYYRLTQLDDVFRVEVQKGKSDAYVLLLRHTESGRQEQFQLEGDQWQLDYRIIRWKPSFFMASEGHLLQFVRLTNRYEDDLEQLNAKRYVYSLRGHAFYQPDLWGFFLKYQAYLPFIETVFGGSVFMPLENGAVYRLQTGYAGLVVKPENRQASEAITQWH